MKIMSCAIYNVGSLGRAWQNSPSGIYWYYVRATNNN